jgi:hypothetical protein
MNEDEKSKKICSFEYRANGDNVLEHAFWQTKSMRDTFHVYNNVISIDSTFNLNKSGYRLNIIITIDGNNDTRIVALGFVTTDKRTDLLTSFFNWFNSNNPDYVNIKTILTDKNQSQIDVLRSIHPDVDLSLCPYHVFLAMKLETHKKLPLFALEEARGI